MMMDIRPIRTDADLDWALAEIEQYFDHVPAPGTPEADRFELLSTLIAAYEDRHYPVNAPDPVATLSAFMALKGYRQADLAPLVGGKGRASEIMNYKRPLTLHMIRRLHKEWQIPAEALIEPYHLDVAPAIGGLTR